MKEPQRHQSLSGFLKNKQMCKGAGMEDDTSYLGPLKLEEVYAA